MRREKRAFCVKRCERMDVDYRGLGGRIRTLMTVTG